MPHSPCGVCRPRLQEDPLLSWGDANHNEHFVATKFGAERHEVVPSLFLAPNACKSENDAASFKAVTVYDFGCGLRTEGLKVYAVVDDAHGVVLEERLTEFSSIHSDTGTRVSCSGGKEVKARRLSS